MKKIKSAKFMKSIITQLAQAHKFDLTKPGGELVAEHLPSLPLTIKVIAYDRLTVRQELNEVEFWVSKGDWYPYAQTDGAGRKCWAEFDAGGVTSLKVNQQADLAKFCHNWANSLRDQGWIAPPKPAVPVGDPECDYWCFPQDTNVYPRDTIIYRTPAERWSLLLGLAEEQGKETDPYPSSDVETQDEGLGLLIARALQGDEFRILWVFRAALERIDSTYAVEVDDWLADMTDTDEDDEDDLLYIEEEASLLDDEEWSKIATRIAPAVSRCNPDNDYWDWPQDPNVYPRDTIIYEPIRAALPA